MNERNNNGRGIFYGVIGVATLVVAIIGATFAYFTATASNEATITGNMATIDLGLTVTKVTDADDNIGLIPMSNSMVEAAITADTPCIDDNGNAVCQIYKVTLSNNSSAAVFVDGYVGLVGGSGEPTDYNPGTTNKTTMRWAQVFADGDDYSTGGTVALGNGESESVTFDDIDTENDDTGMNSDNIKSAFGDVTNALSISGNDYSVININYIRTSDHALSKDSLSADEFYSQEDDVTCALVYNQLVFGKGNTDDLPASRDYYFVVWLSETGTNQNPGEGESTDDFFQGQVKFLSAQGSEVSATFAGYTRVAPTDNTSAAQGA